MKTIFICFVFVFTGGTSGETFEDLFLYDVVTCNHNQTDDVNTTKVDLHFFGIDQHINFTHLIQNANVFNIARLARRVIKSYKMDVNRKIIFYVPDYGTDKEEVEKLNGENFVNKTDVYLMFIDHSAYTSGSNELKSYENAVYHTSHIGKWLGKFLAGFQNAGFLSKNFHLVGHGIGAQILGYTAKTYTEKTNEKIGRVTGLDPAGPCFDKTIEHQLRKGIADYVEVYHCNSGSFGSSSVLADADFFINGGVGQSKCLESGGSGRNGGSGGSGGSDESGGSGGSGGMDLDKCSHNKCVEYWAKSVNPPYYFAWECDSYENFVEGKCALNQMTSIGYQNSGSDKGVFYGNIDQLLYI